MSEGLGNRSGVSYVEGYFSSPLCAGGSAELVVSIEFTRANEGEEPEAAKTALVTVQSPSASIKPSQRAVEVEPGRYRSLSFVVKPNEDSGGIAVTFDIEVRVGTEVIHESITETVRPAPDPRITRLNYWFPDHPGETPLVAGKAARLLINFGPRRLSGVPNEDHIPIRSEVDHVDVIVRWIDARVSPSSVRLPAQPFDPAKVATLLVTPKHAGEAMVVIRVLIQGDSVDELMFYVTVKAADPEDPVKNTESDHAKPAAPPPSVRNILREGLFLDTPSPDQAESDDAARQYDFASRAVQAHLFVDLGLGRWREFAPFLGIVPEIKKLFPPVRPPTSKIILLNPTFGTNCEAGILATSIGSPGKNQRPVDDRIGTILRTESLYHVGEDEEDGDAVQDNGQLSTNGCRDGSGQPHDPNEMERIHGPDPGESCMGNPDGSFSDPDWDDSYLGWTPFFKQQPC